MRKKLFQFLFLPVALFFGYESIAQVTLSTNRRSVYPSPEKLAAEADKHKRVKLSRNWGCVYPNPVKSAIPKPAVRFDDKTVADVAGATPETAALNTAGHCEAYPWLSADGLRVYFTSNREGGHGRPYVAERNNIAGLFGAPKVLSEHLTNGFYAASLSNDELTMYLTKEGYQLYKAVRKSLNSAFGKPELMKEFEKGKFYAPSVSPDGGELFVINTDKEDELQCFRRNGSGEYKFSYKLLLSLEGYDVNPGQLSKDGLTYYLSLEKKSTNKEVLYTMTRKALYEDFSDPEPVLGVGSSQNRIHQPSPNRDGSVLIAVTTASNTWNENDLVQINLKQPPTPEKELYKLITTASPGRAALQPLPGALTLPAGIHLQAAAPALLATLIVPPVAVLAVPAVKVPAGSSVLVYPNPFSSFFTLQLTETPARAMRFVLFDAAGKQVLVQSITSTSTRLRLRSAGGIYTYVLTDAAGKTAATGQLMGQQQ
jgi:hypothetical protein